MHSLAVDKVKVQKTPVIRTPNLCAPESRDRFPRAQRAAAIPESCACRTCGERARQGEAMLRLFRHHIALASVLQLVADGVLCFVAFLVAGMTQLGPYGASHAEWVGPAVVFALLMTGVGASLGLYQQSETDRPGVFVGRAVLAVLAGLAASYLALSFVPAAASVRDASWLAALYAFVGMIVTRQVMRAVSSTPASGTRVLIVGTGPEAQEVAKRCRPTPGRAAMWSASMTQRRRRRTEGRRPHLCSFHGPCRVGPATRNRGGDRLGAGAAGRRSAAARVAGVPGERRPGAGPAGLLRTRQRRGADRFPQGELAHLRTGFRTGISCAARSSASSTTPRRPAFSCWRLRAVMCVTPSPSASKVPASVVYRQERVGLGGRPFMPEFRSMRADAEANGVAQWAGQNDARITRVGRFIRKYRIDELPQLLNVLSGDMSLVGPRPERPCFVDQLKDEIRFYDLRHSVKPGLTGWAQVRYSYGASVEDATRKLQFDLYYVKNHSLFLDVIILVDTVRVVLFGEGSR